LFPLQRMGNYLVTYYWDFNCDKEKAIWLTYNS
jgi:hypothetical protein